jgi:hypothetical protein
MVEETGIDTLAPAVGSVHGGSSRLDLTLLEEIASATSAPLVLHGGSGIHPDDLREALHMNPWSLRSNGFACPGASISDSFVRATSLTFALA